MTPDSQTLLLAEISVILRLEWISPARLLCRYAQYGDVSPKVDVYAFGVVLYELISAKQAVVKMDGSASEAKGLVAVVGPL